MLNKLRQTPRLEFSEFKKIYHEFYQNKPEPHPAWMPTEAEIQQTNLFATMQELNFKTYDELYQWSISHRADFWDYVIKKLGIKFVEPYVQICVPTLIARHSRECGNLGVDLDSRIRGNDKVWEGGNDKVSEVNWLPNAKLNIVDSCFKGDLTKIAIIYQDHINGIKKVSYAELQVLVNRIANSIQKTFSKGDKLAINMPMNIEAVAIYLAIIKAGCVVVSIADSFAADEIATRLHISQAKGIFTQDYYSRNHKSIAIYNKVIEASAPMAIVNIENSNTVLRNGDLSLENFISDNSEFTAEICQPNDFTNILFSSGTTGEPKAIPWTHTTPIKSAMDAFYHQDVHADDIVAWPTNLGWMMGPWLVYACFINNATMALSTDAPTQSSFGQFIQDAKVTILGLVPSIVTAWEVNKSQEACDWSAIKCFSSSGECSSPEDYLYLMWLGNCKPIIEYCGGTEIGGAYISSTLLQANTPATFTTPTLGLDFVLLSEDHQIDEHIGEVALIPPSIGLSQVLINRDHQKVYFSEMPNYEGKVLRRHGDQIEKIADHCYRAQGRVDDTMNLGGIKTSSAEIERILNNLTDIQETAAIAVPPKNAGPSQLVVYAICQKPISKSAIMSLFQKEIKDKLNPLFKLHDVVIVTTLPRTASNKIMRRVLRDEYATRPLE